MDEISTINITESSALPTHVAGNGVSASRMNGRTDLHRATPYRKSYVNDAVEVLRLTGRSMKLQELQQQIRDKRGKAVSLGSLKVCLSRYLDAEDDSKLVTRLAPGLFALSEWSSHGWQDGRRGSYNWAQPAFDNSNHIGSSQPSRLFESIIPPDNEAGMSEQRMYLWAADEDEAMARLHRAGIAGAAQSTLRCVAANGH